MKKDIVKLSDVDGNIVIDEITDSLHDLEGYALCLDMLTKRFDENSTDLIIFFHLFKEMSCYIEQRVGELRHDVQIIRDYAIEDIPA